MRGVVSCYARSRYSKSPSSLPHPKIIDSGSCPRYERRDRNTLKNRAEFQQVVREQVIWFVQSCGGGIACRIVTVGDVRVPLIWVRLAVEADESPTTDRVPAPFRAAVTIRAGVHVSAMR